MFGTEGRSPVGLRRQKQAMPEEIRHLRTEDLKIVSRMKKDNKSQPLVDSVRRLEAQIEAELVSWSAPES